MSDTRETESEPTGDDTQENDTADTEEDTASGGAPADPDPRDL